MQYKILINDHLYK